MLKNSSKFFNKINNHGQEKNFSISSELADRKLTEWNAFCSVFLWVFFLSFPKYKTLYSDRKKS